MEKPSQKILGTPLVTFVIVNYNGGKYLNRCLSSIKEQNLDHECIVIDNDSKDSSKEIQKKLNTKNIFLNN